MKRRPRQPRVVHHTTQHEELKPRFIKKRHEYARRLIICICLSLIVLIVALAIRRNESSYTAYDDVGNSPPCTLGDNFVLEGVKESVTKETLLSTIMRPQRFVDLADVVFNKSVDWGRVVQAWAKKKRTIIVTQQIETKWLRDIIWDIRSLPVDIRIIFIGNLLHTWGNYGDFSCKFEMFVCDIRRIICFM